MKLNFKNPLSVALKMQKQNQIALRLYQLIYYAFSLMSFLLTLTISIATALVLSRLIYADIPDDFFIFTTGCSALITLFMALLNFFLIKDKITMKKSQIIKMDYEILKFKDHLDQKQSKQAREYDLWKHILITSGNELSLTKEQHEVN